MAQRRVTIGDVAAEAGVSVATVSKVINGRWGVAEDTEAKVRKVIESLGYQSSLVAQSLRSRTTNVIGVLVVDIEPFSAELLKGIASAIHGTRYELVVFSGCARADDRVGWEQRYLSRMSGICDGTILVTPSSVDVTYGQPIVAVDHNVGSSDLPTIDSDNFSGAVAATDYLLGLGHRRIGFLSGRPDLESARLRESGYRSALKKAGIPVDPSLIQVGEYEPETAKQATHALLGAAEGPTAIFAANDVMALATIDAARAAGRSIPGDLSVIGFDNVPESALCDPPLTTIEQPIRQMGLEAVELLIGLIEERDDVVTHRMLPTRLVKRASCDWLMSP
jgi:LacI family transcriptional regulator, galactose operon repressor